MKQIHYVATLQVRRVEVEDAKNSQGSFHNTGLIPGRKVGDVISLTLRASTVEDLKQKVKDHLLIIDDDTAIPLDDTSGGAKRG
jgi:hypothetical protein